MQRTRSVLAATFILVLGFSSFAVARSGDPLLEGVRNGTATKETEIVANLGAGSGPTGGYATRQSNLSSTGGGAVYGCRSNGQTGTKPCLRVNNLSSGRAFEFHASSAASGGTFTVGNGGETKKPFTTNATGVADGLNADRVDGQNAADIVATSRSKPGLDADTVDGASASELTTRWALVNEDGAIEQQTGGFSLVNCYQANDNCYVDAGEDVRNNAIQAQVVIQNNDSVNDATVLSGEAGAAPCGAAFVTCAPPDTEANDVIVVAPRTSDGTPPAAPNRLRFYVTVSGSESK